MDNLTHSLLGLTAAKAGLEKLSPGATTLCVLAANSPDADLLTLVFGRWTYLQQHRGISHSIVGVLLLMLALPMAFYVGDLILAKARNRGRTVKLPGLLLVSAVVTASHPLMDWTNNYGVRFLLPWNPRWFYGDFVFVIDPFIWIVLGGAAFLLTSKTKRQLVIWGIIAVLTSCLVLIGPSGPALLPNAIVVRLLWLVALAVVIILYHLVVIRSAGAKIAIASLCIVVTYCAGLAAAHVVALRRAELDARNIASQHNENVLRVAAMPMVANPVGWLCVMETERATYRFNLSLFDSPPGSAGLPEFANIVRYEKPSGIDAEAVAKAERDQRSQVFLGFARFPVMKVAGEDCATQTLVQFADLRYTEPGRGGGTFSLDVPVDCPELETRNR
jgi:inner membrane protein